MATDPSTFTPASTPVPPANMPATAAGLPIVPNKAATPIIEIKGLTKRYRDLVAVRDLNLTIESGEVFGFIGPNGAGKTTTIKSLATLLDSRRAASKSMASTF